MKANYHTHTFRCHHATGTDEQYVRAAIDGEFEVLGFADHAPWPCKGELVANNMMQMGELSGYLQSLHNLRSRYAGRIAIPVGLESEYFAHLHDSLLLMRDMGVSYFILGQHYVDYHGKMPYTGEDGATDDGVLRYADAVVRGIRTGLYTYVAHPDLFMLRRRETEFSGACAEAADMICQAAKEQGMPLEYNISALKNKPVDRGFPSTAFWTHIQKHGCDAILGVDAHDPIMLSDQNYWNNGMEKICSLGYRPLAGLASIHP